MTGRLARLLLILLLAACSAPAALPPPGPATRASALDAALAPYEDRALIPPQIADLPFVPGRAYAVLVLLPSPAAVDLSDPQRAHHGLGGFLNPAAVWSAGTSVGHALVGWRCADGTFGMASKTGDSRGAGYRLLRQGWGVGALLATYDDGHVYRLDEEPARHRRALRHHRARIVAMEIDAASCQHMRRSLAAYLAEPAPVLRHYTLLPTRARPQGDACAGFALWLAGQGGATGGLPRHLMRHIVLRDSFVGRGRDPGPRVVPLATAATEPLPLLRLLTGDWSQGRAVGAIDFLDMELFQLALERAEARAGVPRAPRIDVTDPEAAGAIAAADRWLDRWPRAQAVTAGGVRAVLLSRG